MTSQLRHSCSLLRVTNLYLLVLFAVYIMSLNEIHGRLALITGASGG